MNPTWMDTPISYRGRPISLRPSLLNTPLLKPSAKENGFSPSTPRPGLLGKPYANGAFSWGHPRVDGHAGTSALTKHRGPRADESRLAPVTHERNYEKKPRRKMRQAKPDIESGRKRKRDKRESGENIAGRHLKEARTEHMLKRVLPPRGGSRDRLTLPPTYKTGLFKKGRSSRPVKSGLSDLVFSEMRFLAESSEDQAATDEATMVSGREDPLGRSIGLRVSHWDRTQQTPDIACLANRANDREEPEGKIKARHGTSNAPRARSLTPKGSTSDPDCDNQGCHVALQALWPPVNRIWSQTSPGLASKKKPQSIAVNAAVTSASHSPREIAEGELRNHVPRQPRAMSRSPAIRRLGRNGQPQKAQDEEFAIEDYLDRVTERRDDGEYKELSSPLSALLRVCSVSPKSSSSARGTKSEASRVLGSATNIPPRGIKDLLEPSESRDQRGFQIYTRRGYYEGEEYEQSRELMGSEKTKFEACEGQTKHGGDQRDVYKFEGGTISNGGLGNVTWRIAGGRRPRVGANDVATPPLEEWLDSTDSECLGIEYVEGGPPRGLLGADAEPYTEGGHEQRFAEMSPGTTRWDRTNHEIDPTNRREYFREAFDVTGAGGMGGSGARRAYGGGGDCTYSRGVVEGDAELYSILGFSNASPGFRSRFWRPNLCR